MGSPVGNRKRALRAELRERRRNFTSTEKAAAEEGLTRKLIHLVSQLPARSLSCYLSAPNEPNTRPFLNWAHEQGIRVLLPRDASRSVPK